MATLAFLPFSIAIASGIEEDAEITSKDSVWKPPWLQPELFNFDRFETTDMQTGSFGRVKNDSNRHA
ncbi:hypothetical protein L7F22_031831 [Adiantum nelumboides]|nr:hypothetical protein [Adiantum nelumboides]